MSQWQEPDPATPPPGEEHGAMEELREEIKQVVEHVPRPVRWTVRKLVLLAGLSLVAFVVLVVVSVLLYFSNRTELVAKELTVFLNGTLAQRSDVTVEISDVRGDLLGDVRLINPRVVFRDGEGPPLLETPEVRVRYSAWNLITGGRTVDIQIESPTIRLGKLPDGRLRLPEWRSSGKPPGRPREFDVRLRVRNGQLQSPNQKIIGLAVDASAGLGRGTRLLVRDVSWKEGFYDTRNLKLSGELAAGDSVLFLVRELRADDLLLKARGGWKKGSSVRFVHADIERVRWQWLSRATQNRSFDVPGEGQATIDATIDHRDIRGQFVTRLTWSDLPAQGRGDFWWTGGRLAVEPLVAASAAGNLNGRAVWSKKGWEVGGRVVGGNPVHWGAIGIHNWPEGNLNGEFLYGVVSGPRSTAHLTARLGPSELVRWKADVAQVEVDFPRDGPDHFTVDMTRLGGQVKLVGESTADGWRGDYVATQFPLEEWPDGRASGIRGVLSQGQGTVEGRGGELHVTGELSGVSTDWLGARMERWHVDQIQGRLLPTPDLTARAELKDVLFLATQFDSVIVALQLGNQTVALKDVVAHAGDTLITAAGNSSWSPAGWRVTLDRAEAKSPQFHWIAEPPVALSGDKQGVLFERFAARDSVSRFEFAGRWGVPGGSYDWSARAQRLDLARLGLPTEWRLAGSADVAVEIHGPAESPRWTLEATGSGPAWQGHRADSLDLSLVGTPYGLEVQRATVHLDGGTLALEGRVTGTKTASPDTLTAQGLTRWIADAEQWQGKLSAKSLPLGRLKEWSPKASAWSGKLSGELEIDGSPSRPVLEATVTANPLAWQTYRADEFKARASYENGKLSVPELSITRGNLVSRISGQMPLRLAVGSRLELPEEPMQWRAAIPNGDLAVLPLFVPQIGSASGKFELEAEIAGTPKKPDLNGYLRVRDGELRMAAREEVLQKVSADFRLDESRITLDSLSARQGERGRVHGKGVVEIAGTGLKGYRFELVMREFTAIETGLYAAEFDGNFTVTDGQRVGRQILPMVEGNMNLRRAVILFDFANQSEVQRIAATTKPLFWTYRVQVVANNNLHWQPPDGDVEFTADLSLEQTLDQLIIYGEMHAVRGTYYFLSNRFTVNRADLMFDNLQGVDPVIDAEATTSIAPSGEPASYSIGAGVERPESHQVTVIIHGRSSEPLIEFRSDPNDWDEARILRELTVGRFYAGGVTLGDPLDNYLTRAINKTLSSEMSRVFRGYINEWSLDRQRGGLISGEGDVILGVGSQITPQLQLRYRQRVPGLGHQAVTTIEDPFERDFEAEYRLSRLFYVTSEVTQRRVWGEATTSGTGAPEFNVNLKARWEY